MKLIGLVCATVAAALWVLFQRSAPPGPPNALLVWLLACFVGEALWTRVPGRDGTISMALVLNIGALAILGNRGSVEVIALSTLVAGIYPHRRPWFKILFNTAQSTLAAAAALFLLGRFESGPLGALLPVSLWWPALLLAGLAFFCVNTGLVSCAISLSSGLSLWQSWRENFGYTFELASSLAQITLSSLLLVAYAQIGPWALLFVLPIIVVLAFSSSREASARRQASHPEPAALPETLQLTG